MVEAALIGSTHEDLDDASLWSQTDRDAALKGLMGPVSSVEAGPFLVEVKAPGQLDAGGGFTRIDDEGAFHRQLNGDGLASRNIENVVFIGRFRLSNFDQRNMLDQIFRGISHRAAPHEEREGKNYGCEKWSV